MLDFTYTFLLAFSIPAHCTVVLDFSIVPLSYTQLRRCAEILETDAIVDDNSVKQKDAANFSELCKKQFLSKSPHMRLALCLNASTTALSWYQLLLTLRSYWTFWTRCVFPLLHQQVVVGGFSLHLLMTWSYHTTDYQLKVPVHSVWLVQFAGILCLTT